MKSNNNQNRSGLIRKSLGVISILGLLALAFGAGTYSELVRKIEVSSQDAKALECLTRAARINLLLQSLNKGHVTEARYSLTLDFTNDLAMADSLSADANPKLAAQVKETLAQFARDQKAHPDYYIVSLRPSDLHSARNLQMARQDAKP